MGLSGDTDKQFGWGCRLGSPAGSAGPRAVLRAEQGQGTRAFGEAHLLRQFSSVVSFLLPLRFQSAQHLCYVQFGP